MTELSYTFNMPAANPKVVSDRVIGCMCLTVRGDWGRFDQGHNSALATFKAAGRSSDDPANRTSLTDM